MTLPPPPLSTSVPTAPPCPATGAVYSNRFRKALMGRIATLSSAAHEEIFRMLKENGTNHTRNKHGIHINLSAVDDALIGRISAFVDYCVSKDRDLLEYNNKLEEYRRNRRFGALPLSQQHQQGEEGESDDKHGETTFSSNAAAEDVGEEDDDKAGCGDHGDGGGEREATALGGGGGGGGEAATDAAEGTNTFSSASLSVPPPPPPPPHDNDGASSFCSRMAPSSSSSAQLSPHQRAHLRRLNQELQPLHTAIQMDAEAPARRRNANTKYAAARKKYSRRRGVDRRGEGTERLLEEPYLIASPPPPRPSL